MMNEMTLLLSDEELDFVVGGNKGDSDIERRLNKPLYQMGQEINFKIYEPPAFMFSGHAKILGLWKTEQGHYAYHVQTLNRKRPLSLIVIADDIMHEVG